MTTITVTARDAQYGRDQSWTVYSEADYRARIDEWAGRRGSTVFEAITPRALLAQYAGQTPETPREEMEDVESDWITDLADQYGWDTTLYRADYLTGAGQYRAEPITRQDAYDAAAVHDTRSDSRVTRG